MAKIEAIASPERELTSGRSQEYEGITFMETEQMNSFGFSSHG